MVTIVYAHGGVSGLPAEPLPSLGYAVQAGLSRLGAVDAVEAAVRCLEDDPRFNAGFGAVLDADGRLELDAGIADGTTGRCGGVANVRVRNPISLARRVLEQTPHVLVTGEGANALGADLEVLEDTSGEQRDRWIKARRANKLGPEHYGSPDHVDTVGAVALGSAGRLAAGSSTGGVFAKLPGRVGDAPICGAGILATESAAVVGTGVGELFLETLAAARAGRFIEDGSAPQEACEAVVAYLGTRRRVAAGLLAVDTDGRVGAAYRGGSWAVEGPEGPVAAVRLD